MESFDQIIKRREKKRTFEKFICLNVRFFKFFELLSFTSNHYIKSGVSKNAVLKLFFLHSFWIHHEKTVNILVHCWDHENKP